MSGLPWRAGPPCRCFRPPASGSRDAMATAAGSLVERDAAQTVTLYAVNSDKVYDVAAKMPLVWLLQTSPADHHIAG